MSVMARAFPSKGGTLRSAPPVGPVPTDTRLPGLAGALDAGTMLERLRPHLPAGRRDLTISYVRYKPGQSCIIQYRVLGDDGETVFHGRSCPSGAFEQTLAKATSMHRPIHPGERPVLGFAELGLVLVRFPHDRAIKGMRHLLDTDKLKRILRDEVACYMEENIWISGSRSQVEVVSYKPERSCLVRCRLRIKNRDTGCRTHETIYARAYAGRTGARVQATLSALQNECATAFPAESVPRPLGYDADRRLLFQAEVPGQPLLVRSEGADDARWLRETGLFLARLHASGAARWAGPRSALILEQAAAGIERLEEAGVVEARVLQAVVDRLRATRPATMATAVCLHGDFHPEQILVGVDGLRCIDFDATGAGEAGLDVGYFLAHLRRLVRLGVRDDDTELAAAFLDGYGSLGAGAGTPRWAWYRDLTFLRMALSSIKHLERDWTRTVAACLAEIEA